MQLSIQTRAQDFLDLAFEPLCRDEARNNLMVGIAGSVRDGRRYGDEAPLFLTVHEGGELVAAALRTPPYPMILHCEEDRPGALDLIIDHLLETSHHIPGVNGMEGTARTFAGIWTERTGQTASIEVALRIYTLTEVTPVRNVPGAMRWAEDADVPLLATWYRAFHDEVAPHDPPPGLVDEIRKLASSRKLAIWENDGPVSMVGRTRETPHGGTIGPVYTPPDHRGRGYASACVAGVSQAILTSGKDFCTLYTDLANPTSNKIYQNIGYRPAVECAMYTFAEP